MSKRPRNSLAIVFDWYHSHSHVHPPPPAIITMIPLHNYNIPVDPLLLLAKLLPFLLAAFEKTRDKGTGAGAAPAPAVLLLHPKQQEGMQWKMQSLDANTCHLELEYGGTIQIPTL